MLTLPLLFEFCSVDRAVSHTLPGAIHRKANSSCHYLLRFMTQLIILIGVGGTHSDGHNDFSRLQVTFGVMSGRARVSGRERTQSDVFNMNKEPAGLMYLRASCSIHNTHPHTHSISLSRSQVAHCLSFSGNLRYRFSEETTTDYSNSDLTEDVFVSEKQLPV